MAEEIKSQCGMCPAACGIIVKVEGGKVVGVSPDKEDFHTRGYMCFKGRLGLDLLEHPDRLRVPLIRDRSRGEKDFREASWDEALEFIARRLTKIREQDGPQSLAVYRGQAGAGLGSVREYITRFMNLYGSPNRSGPGYICRAARGYAAMATYGSMTEPAWEDSDCGVIWAMSVLASKGAAGSQVIKAKKRGGKLIVIDPLRHKFAEMADLWLRPKYGTDCWLALAAVNVVANENLYKADFVNQWCTGWDEMVEHVKPYTPEAVEPITGVPAEDIRAFARMYANSPTAYIADGNGIDQHANATQTGRAICLLRALTGNLDVPGGDLFRVPIPRKVDTLKHMLPKDATPLGGVCLGGRLGSEIPAPPIVDAILTGRPYPIKAWIIEGGNPAVVVPNTARTREALEKIEFLVVHEIFMTRTAQHADVVLPATTYFESTACSPGVTRTRYLRLQSKAIEPMYQSRCDYDFWFDLGRAMGYGEYFPWKSAEEAIDEELEPAGYTCSQIAKEPVVFPEERRKYLQEGFRTPSGKIELYSTLLEQYGFDPLPSPVDPYEALGIGKDEYPLICSNWPLSHTYTHSAQRNIPSLRKVEPEPLFRLHPDEAARHGIKDGDVITAENNTGRMRARCELTDAVPVGCIALTWGWGEAEPDADIGAMVSGKVTDPIIGAVSSRFIPVRIAKDSAAD